MSTRKCANRNCDNQIPEDSPTAFCSDSCKDKFWSFSKYAPTVKKGKGIAYIKKRAMEMKLEREKEIAREQKESVDVFNNTPMFDGVLKPVRGGDKR